MATPPKGTDRRVQRTREVIRQAFVEVVQEKGLAGASVQKVVERANISRGTFYAHYEDKYALVDSIVREGFQQATSTIPMEWNRKTLDLLIQTVLEYFKSIYQHHHRSWEIAPHLERAIHEELSKLIFALLKQSNARPDISLEMMAQVIGWTIFGAAVYWSQDVNALPAAQTAHEISTLIFDGIRQ